MCWACVREVLVIHLPWLSRVEGTGHPLPKVMDCLVSLLDEVVDCLAVTGHGQAG